MYKWLEKELGVDKALNYKDYATALDLKNALQEVCPKGIDIYFGNHPLQYCVGHKCNIWNGI